VLAAGLSQLCFVLFILFMQYLSCHCLLFKISGQFCNYIALAKPAYCIEHILFDVFRNPLTFVNKLDYVQATLTPFDKCVSLKRLTLMFQRWIYAGYNMF